MNVRQNYRNDCKAQLFMITAFYFIFKGGLLDIICAPQISKQILNFLIALTFQTGMKKISDYPLIKHFHIQEVKKKKYNSGPLAGRSQERRIALE